MRLPVKIINKKGPLAYYQQQVENGLIFSDSAQLLALQSLERVYANLLSEQQKRAGFMSFLRKKHLIKGVYLWGGVGIGKTLLMDCLYQSLPFQNKLRMHFHAFMRRIHDQLTLHQGEQDPLPIIAHELARETMVLCFDELFVSDIADAMLLGRLFKALFAEGICLVTTSNVAPDDLYKNGVNRNQFLSAIALLKAETEIIPIPFTRDYRLRHLKTAGVFYTPLNKEAEENMEKSFAILTAGKSIDASPICINNRLIPIKKQAGDAIWFDFTEICTIPRSQRDYLLIAEKYRHVFISQIPMIKPEEKDTICLFISLIDVLYDARVKLVISSAEPVEQIYLRGYMISEYTRTHSRLLEMQSWDYFSNDTNL